MEKILVTPQKTALFLLRQDLRIHDQLPLDYAIKHKLPILPIFVHDEVRQGKWKLGLSSKWWLNQSLTKLQKRYAKDGHALKLYKGDTLQIIDNLVKTCDVSHILYNKCYEKYNRDLEKDIKDMYNGSGVKVCEFNGNIMTDPEKILNQQGSFFKVFTPFYRRFCAHYEKVRAPIDIDLSQIAAFDGTPITSEKNMLSPCTVEELDLIDPTFDTFKFPSWWNPGEEGGVEKLESWLSKVGHYKALRDFPGKKATSRLSPHYHFGEVSPYLAWNKVKNCEGQKKEGVDHYLFEVGWREFSYYLLYYVPDLPEENFQKKFDAMVWSTDKDDVMLKAWEEGKTGIPIVDAGMRELKAVGWMHNRVRMICASFLGKDLLLDWRKGEKHFWKYLVDADLAANAMGWQWVAGCGADASPWFRVFNPFLQSEKFDAEGLYIKKWCPELTSLSKKYVHNPSEVSPNILKTAGVT